MKQDLRKILLAMTLPVVPYFYPLYNKDIRGRYGLGLHTLRSIPYGIKRGMFGIFCTSVDTQQLCSFICNTLPLFFLTWCLFYFYRGIAPYIFFIIWIGCGTITFIIGKPGWHIGASGVIYGLAFFLFFSGLLRKYTPLIAISLLVTFLYGGLVWQMFPYFTPANTSWEGHLSGAIMGSLCAFAFIGYGPQRPEPFAEEEEEEEEKSNTNEEEIIKQAVSEKEELTNHATGNPM